MSRLISLACLCLAPLLVAAAPRPNILVIVSDDMGFSDIGCYGGEIQVQKVASNNTAAELRKTELMKKWWAHMADIMETNPDNSPVRVPLEQVFHQD